MTKFNDQLDFIKEIDKLKQVVRRNYLLDGSRSENTAEHSWHASLSALILEEYSNQPVDIYKVAAMLLIHDLVEIEAGDTYIYDPNASIGQDERELQAANNLFTILPEEQAQKYFNLWLEFEDRSTTEARFAKAIDRFMPMLANYTSGGKSWLEHRVTKQRMLEINAIIADGSQRLWEKAQEMIEDAAQRGLLV